MENIRSAMVEDISRIAEIFVVNYRVNFYQFFHNDEYYFKELNVLAVADEYKSEPEKIKNTFVFDDNVVRGFIRIIEKEIEKLFVEPLFQNQKIGQKLLNFAIDNFNVNNLWALEYNQKGIAFYKRNGFNITTEKILEDDWIPLVKLVRQKNKI